MLTQVFRNRIAGSPEFQKKVRRIESVIRSNCGKNQSAIVAVMVNEWNRKPLINLQPFHVNGSTYFPWLEFTQAFTHGAPYVSVEIELEEGVFVEQDEFDTEFGDLAIIVEYYLEQALLSSRLSILQTKKETKQDQAEVSLNQLYLMQFWPSVRFANQTFKFNSVASEDFSFYHFILDKSRRSFCSSTICSSPLVLLKLGLTKSSLVSQLRNWISQRKSSGVRSKAPVLPFNRVMPGAVDAVSTWGRNNWGMVPKPFSRFLHEAAYLFVGTPNEQIRRLAESRVPNILLLKARASRERRRE